MVSGAMRSRKFFSFFGPICQNMAVIYFKLHLNIYHYFQLHASVAVFKSRYQVPVIEFSIKPNIIKEGERATALLISKCRADGEFPLSFNFFVF